MRLRFNNKIVFIGNVEENRNVDIRKSAIYPKLIKIVQIGSRN